MPTNPRAPSPGVFHDAVAEEDPRRWGLGPRTERPVATTPAPVVAHPERIVQPRFSVGATFLGWSVAAFFTIVLVAVRGLVLDAAGVEGRAGELIGYIGATFFAFVLGGYAAGRMAIWDGVTHALGTVAWGLLFGIVGISAGAFLVESFPALGPLATFLPLTPLQAFAIFLTLIAQIVGAAIGGRLGVRYHERLHGVSPTPLWPRRRVGGRPL